MATTAQFAMNLAVDVSHRIVEKETIRLSAELLNICEKQFAEVGERAFLYQGNVYPPDQKGVPPGLAPVLSEAMFKWSQQSKRLSDDKAYLTQGLYILFSHKIHRPQDMFDALPDHINSLLNYPAEMQRTRPPYWNMDDTKGNKRLIEGLSDKAHFYYTLSVIG